MHVCYGYNTSYIESSFDGGDDGGRERDKDGRRVRELPRSGGNT